MTYRIKIKHLSPIQIINGSKNICQKRKKLMEVNTRNIDFGIVIVCIP